MKRKNISFLFFYSLLPFFVTMISGQCAAQEKSDSLNYYYYAILNPKEPEHLPDGISYYSRRRERNLINGDTLSAIGDLRMIAIGQFKIGNVYDSENSIVEALDLINKLKDGDTLIESRVGLHNQLGRVYRSANNYEEALKSFEEALKLAPNTKDSITILNNKANVYKDMLQYQQALNQYVLVYDKTLGRGDSLQLAMVLDNLGYVQGKLNLPSALDNLNKALEVRLKENELAGIYRSYKNLTHFFLDKNDKKNALLYADKAYAVAKKLNNGGYMQDALSLFVELDEDLKVKEYKRLTDSIVEARQLAENKNAYIKYNVEEERKKTEASRLQQEKEKRLKLLYKAIAVFILLALLASYFIFRYRYKKGRLEQAYNTETRISKKVHDEVANDVYQVMTRLENNPDVEPEVMDDLENIYSKTRDISRENSPIDFNEDFDVLLNDLFLSFKNQKVNIVTRNIVQIEWGRVSDLKKTAIYRVLQELLTNMKKHSQASLVALTFNKSRAKVSIDYKDNGIGCELKKKLGLQNAENRITSLKGTITFVSQRNNGFEVHIIV